ncbi:hypothetical protein A1E_01700 [Rickettsia canadensis str. McKiel]|uniref:Uncharacterized protein n=1 Tax=Rickettsia canadensis (strain McKiel) TaxID=293613 RepID=A8EY52_RICCK|nr:hypothetical protein A1E_01700 [Rickettsia canadensis str. McKiel]
MCTLRFDYINKQMRDFLEKNSAKYNTQVMDIEQNIFLLQLKKKI